MSDATALALAPFVSAAAAGDRAAFEHLVNETRNVVCAITMATVRDAPMSEDVAQDVYLEAWKGIRRLRNPTSFLPWLRQLARNRSRMALRATIRQRNRVSTLDSESILAAAADPSESALDHLVQAEERKRLGEALDALPSASREVLVLYYREGGSVRQVAELLGISEAAVKQRLSRSRESVRQALLNDVGSALARTAPGLAFTAAVVGGLSAAAPGVAAAATLAGSQTSAATGALSSSAVPASGSAVAGITGGIVGGLTGVLSGARQLMSKARDDSESRGIRVYAAAGSTIVLLFMSAIMFRPSPAVMALAFLAAFAGMCLLTMVYLPRVTARRKAAELRENPAAAQEHERERRKAALGAALGFILGGLPILLYWLLQRS